jgi:hypothetical protein
MTFAGDPFYARFVSTEGLNITLWTAATSPVIQTHVYT